MLDIVDIRVFLILIAIFLFLILRAVENLADQIRHSTNTKKEYAEMILQDLQDIRSWLVRIENKN